MPPALVAKSSDRVSMVVTTSHVWRCGEERADPEVNHWAVFLTAPGNAAASSANQRMIYPQSQRVLTTNTRYFSPSQRGPRNPIPEASHPFLRAEAFLGCVATWPRHPEPPSAGQSGVVVATMVASAVWATVVWHWRWARGCC
jgi:hypothetical protein